MPMVSCGLFVESAQIEDGTEAVRSTTHIRGEVSPMPLCICTIVPGFADQSRTDRISTNYTPFSLPGQVVQLNTPFGSKRSLSSKRRG